MGKLKHLINQKLKTDHSNPTNDFPYNQIFAVLHEKKKVCVFYYVKDCDFSKYCVYLC